MGKPGVVMIGLVLVVATLGVAAAGFSDELKADGTVSTGTTGYEILGWSETWVYNHIVDGLVVETLVLDEPADPVLFPEPEYILVGSADVDDQEPGMLQDPDTETKEMSVTYDSVVPGIDFSADVVIRNTSSIPVHLVLDELDWGGEEELADYVTVTFLLQPASGGDWTVVTEDVVQLHENDLLEIVFTARTEEGDEPFDTSGAFSTAIGLEQWNE